MIEALKAHLIAREGLRLRPYKCSSGKLTLGVGRNIEDNGITTEEAMYLLTNDINNTIEELETKFEWFPWLPVNAQLVLADMCFNLGLPTLLSFKKMLKAIEKKKWNKASKEILDSRYAKQVGNRAIYNAHLLENAGKESWQPKILIK
jgi:lysozyme